MGRRDVWLDTAEQARGAVRLLLMCDVVAKPAAVRALSQINLIGDRPHQLDACVMDLAAGCDMTGLAKPETKPSAGYDLL